MHDALHYVGMANSSFTDFIELTSYLCDVPWNDTEQFVTLSNFNQVKISIDLLDKVLTSDENTWINTLK